MTKYFIAVLAVLSSIAMASTPDDISYKNSKAVYVDFSKAIYNINYNIKAQIVTATSQITFTQASSGYPIFDLVPDVIEATVDGKAVNVVELKAPGDVTTYKTLTSELNAGEHTLVIKNRIKENVTFSNGGVQSAFWMGDLSDRNFLEQYLPTNMEFDPYQIVMNIDFTNARKNQVFYTNGTIKQRGSHSYQITFPETFSTSSLYFHTSTSNRFYEKKFTMTLKSGKQIPVVIYSRTRSYVSRAYTETVKVMKELENNMGPWPHNQIVAYIAGRGGMEYCGATITSLSALGHELTHSYYARGVMPTNGNSGWIDEAIATWRGNEYPKTSSPNFSNSKMASHSIYRRSTDRDAYSKGANFMAYLNDRMENQGGLLAFLRPFFAKHVFKRITTEQFRSELEEFTGHNYEAEFRKYIYGMDSNKHLDESSEENPHHPKLTSKELQSLL